MRYVAVYTYNIYIRAACGGLYADVFCVFPYSYLCIPFFFFLSTSFFFVFLIRKSVKRNDIAGDGFFFFTIVGHIRCDRE